MVERGKMTRTLEIRSLLGGDLILDTALGICKECEYSLATCPYEMAVAECPKTRDAILKVMRGDLEEEMVEE